MMTDNLDAEIARLAEVLRRRGMFFDDEAGSHGAYTNVRQWLADDKVEAERIEVAAAEAEKTSDPNYRTRDLFKNVKISIPRKDR